MRIAILRAAALTLGAVSMTGISAEQSMSSSIIRKPLLTAIVDGEKNVQRVEIKEIEFAPHQQTGLHLHPIPVVGYIVDGTVSFQIEGQPLQTLNAGDAFFEPANVKILHFDAGDKKVKFTVYYLLGKDDREIITMLK